MVDGTIEEETKDKKRERDANYTPVCSVDASDATGTDRSTVLELIFQTKK